MYKIVLDVMGGDNSPIEQVKGAVMAVNEEKNLHVVLAGDEEKIKEVLKTEKYNPEQISFLDAKDVITNDDIPTVAIKQKNESSLVKALNETRLNDEIAGMVSTGSTGAVLTGGFLKIGRLKGVSRPALCPILPTKLGGIVALCDSGANMDCKPTNLVHFAVMASTYVEKVYGIKNPRVGLLSVGTEDHKGNDFTKQVFAMLKAQESINFVGNMEARDLLSGDYDVIVADGFNGNVLLKSAEGALLTMFDLLKQGIKSSFLSKIGYLFMKGTFKQLKSKLDYNKHGGAVLLGCKKIIVKGHGSSKATSVCECLKQAVNMCKADICDEIENRISQVKVEDNND